MKGLRKGYERMKVGRAYAFLVAGVLFLVASGTASAALIAQYTFYDSGDTYSATTAASNVTPSVYDTNASNKAFSSDVPTGGGPTSITSDGWNVADMYYFFSLDVDGGYELTLDDLTFDYSADASGVASYDVRYSTDGFATAGTSIGNGALIKDGTWYSVAADPGTPISGLTGTVSFRLYGSGANNAGKDWLHDNVTVNGSVIPEPATLGLLVLAGLARLRRRRA